MIETILSITEFITSVIPIYQKNRSKKSTKEFSDNIMLIYLKLLEITEVAEKINNNLKNHVRKNTEYIKRGETWDYNYKNELKELLYEQAINLTRLNSAIRPVYVEISILNPKLQKKIYPFVKFKFNLLSKLAELYSLGVLPVFEENINDSYRISPYIDDDNSNIEIITRGSKYEKISINKDVLNTNIEWDETIYQEMKDISKKYKFDLKLEHLQSVLETLRSFIIEHFSLDQILISTKKCSNESSILIEHIFDMDELYE